VFERLLNTEDKKSLTVSEGQKLYFGIMVVLNNSVTVSKIHLIEFTDERIYNFANLRQLQTTSVTLHKASHNDFNLNENIR